MVKKLSLLSALTFIGFVVAESNVIELNDTSFESQVNTQETILVEYFAPWCGHCKALAPEYEIAATELKDIVPLAKIDCSVYKSLCEEHGVTGYPNLKIYKSGKPTDYSGIRKSKDIIEYMKKQAGPSLRELDASNFEEFQKLDHLVVVGYSGDDHSKDLLKQVAEKHRSRHFFGIITDPELAKEHGAQVPSVVVYKQFDEGRNDLRTELTIKSIEDFIIQSSVPLVQDITVSNLRYYIECGIPLAYIFYDSESSRKELKELFTPIALKQKGKVNFVFMDASRYGSHASMVGLKESFPAFAIQHFEDGTKYPFDQTKEMSSENMDRFVQDYVEGKLETTVRSAEPPVENNGPVKVVVAKEFSNIVLDVSKDVFLNVYAPWGDYNNELESVWNQIGETIAKLNDDSIVIAKLDHSTNDIPEEAGFRLAALPTLVFYKAVTNELSHYDGDRSLQSLIDFINEQKSSKSTQIEVSSENTSKESTNAHDEL